MITQDTKPKTLVLVATNDYGATHRYELQNDKGVFVGKSSNCGLQLHDEKLADIHCRIGMSEGKLKIQSWMSAVGMLVNNREIDGEQEFGPEDIVQIGGHKIRAVTAAQANVIGDGATATESERTSRVAEQFLADDIAESDAGSLEWTNDDTESLLESPTASLLDTQVEEPAEIEIPVEEPIASDEADEIELQLEPESDSIDTEADMDVDFFSFEEEETYDRETVALLQAEIEDLRAALAQRDAESLDDIDVSQFETSASAAEASDDVLKRLEELVEEANQSDERVALLEEMLHAAEDANRSERQERTELEAWVRDIEARIGQREDEHSAEVDALKERLEQSSSKQERMLKQLRQAGNTGSKAASRESDALLDDLQKANRDLEDRLAESQKRCLSLEKKIDAAEGDSENLLRSERAKIAKEQAKISRLRYELSSKLADIETAPKAEKGADQENGQRIRALREHLREIHEEEKLEPKDTSIAARLSKMWKRVEY